MLRCPLCANLSHQPLSATMLRCLLCALLFDRENAVLPDLERFKYGRSYVFPAWNNWAYKLTGRLTVMKSDPVAFARPTVRMFAASRGQRAGSITTSVPCVPLYAKWPFGSRIRADLQPRPPAKVVPPDPRLTLGIIAAEAEGDAVCTLCERAGGFARDVVVVLDTASTAAAAMLATRLRASLSLTPDRRLEVIARPMRDDFAAQRNRVQEAARTQWVLQLDTDEEPAPGLARILSCLLDDADAAGWLCIGLTRRNLVEGVVSALYPDPQFRLLRHHIRYTGKVHEAPDLRSHRGSHVHLGPGLIHHIPRWRLRQRQDRYEAIQDGAGRPNDTALLSLPLEAGTVVHA